MAEQLNPLLEDRIAYPFAVGVQMPDEAKPIYTHFHGKVAASFFADMFRTEGNEVTCWVAITEPEYLMSAVVPGWRQVSWSYL